MNVPVRVMMLHHVNKSVPIRREATSVLVTVVTW